MNNLKQYLYEALKINSKSKIKENILDQDVNTLEELRNIIITYFPKAKVGEIKNEEYKFKFQKSNDGVKVNQYFIVKFYNSKNKIDKKLQFAKYKGAFIMQLIIKDYKDKWQQLRIHGFLSAKDEFKIGENFFDLLMKIKEGTDKKDILIKGEEIVKLFKLNEFN